MRAHGSSKVLTAWLRTDKTKKEETSYSFKGSPPATHKLPEIGVPISEAPSHPSSATLRLSL